MAGAASVFAAKGQYEAGGWLFALSAILIVAHAISQGIKRNMK